MLVLMFQVPFCIVLQVALMTIINPCCKRSERKNVGDDVMITNTNPDQSDLAK